MHDSKDIDLEKLRDEKCIPIARQMVKELASDLLPVDGTAIPAGPLAQKFLKFGLDADLNITTEASYIFQLTLGVLSGLNVTVQGVETVPIDDVRYFDIGRKILGFVTEHDVTIGSVTPDQTQVDFAPIKEKINALIAEEKLSMLEVKYIMDNIFKNFTLVNNLFSESLEENSRRAEAKLFGIEDMTDLSMSKLDSVLKAE